MENVGKFHDDFLYFITGELEIDSNKQSEIKNKDREISINYQMENENYDFCLGIDDLTEDSDANFMEWIR